jgi:ferredoxin
VSPDGRVLSEAEWAAHVDQWLPSGGDRAFVRSLMGRVVEPGKFANWIAPPVMGINRQPVDFEYVRFPDSPQTASPAPPERESGPAKPVTGDIAQCEMAWTAVIKQHLIDPEICIRCNTCETMCPVGAITPRFAQLRGGRRQVQLVQRLHLALPHRQHRQLPHHAARQAYSLEINWAGTNCRPS